MISQTDILQARILIVDDQETNIALLAETLRGAGYQNVTGTTDPRQVSALYRQNRYDLVLLDLQMPGMDGFQVMAELKEFETGGYLPVLVITAQPEHKLRALKAGARDFVSKPFELPEVLLRVRNMVEVRLLQTTAQGLTEQLEESNRELQAFSYSVSHDLRAPLRHVLGFVDLLQMEAGPTLSEKGRGHMKTISEAAKRMGTLIDDLLAFSRVGRTEMKKSEVNLDELARDAMGDFAAETNARNIQWTVAALPRVWGDRSLLRLALINLLANAVKFTGGRAAATIEIGCEPGGPGETVGFVRDNGAGFDPQYRGKLFGVFQRLHSHAEFEGTGIGLANVQRIIHRHGGRVWAEGAVDGGATFYFSIPNLEKA